MTDKICKNYFVSGKVQGVWFRASTQKEAIKLGIGGWVRNLPDGRVEVMACGSTEQMAAFEAWLQHGPTLAAVADLQSETLLCHAFVTFEII